MLELMEQRDGCGVTICLKVLPSKLTWCGRVFRRGDIIRYHSHNTKWINDFYFSWGNDGKFPHPESKIDDETLRRIATNGWFEEVVYHDYYCLGEEVRD